MSDVPVKRPYNNAARREQAQLTRERILVAAREAFLADGYNSTTIRAIAERAGTSVETVYKQFGTKAALARQVLDVAIAGDDEPVAMPDRPQTKSIGAAADATEMLRRYSGHARRLLDRVGLLAPVLLLGPRDGDGELSDMRRQADEQRLRAATMLASAIERSGQLRTDIDRERARDIIWALNSPEFYCLLTLERGRSGDEYEGTLAEALVALLVEPRMRARRPRAGAPSIRPEEEPNS